MSKVNLGMAKVALTLNGRAYTVACAEGQEDRLRYLASKLDARLKTVARSAMSASDAHLLAVVGLMMVDELEDAQKEARELRVAQPTDQEKAVLAEEVLKQKQGEETAIAEMLEKLSTRLDTMAEKLENIESFIE